MAMVLDERTTQMVATGAVVRHMMKCKRGEQCPVMNCWALQAEKDQLIQEWTSYRCGKAGLYGPMHYEKCIKVLPKRGLCALLGSNPDYCLCESIRHVLKEFKEEYFNESPMSLQMQAACAIPKDQMMMMMNPYPHREEILRLKYSAERIQRKWRQFVHYREEKMRWVEAQLSESQAQLSELLRELGETGTS